jgi:hypothetical protein
MMISWASSVHLALATDRMSFILRQPRSGKMITKKLSSALLFGSLVLTQLCPALAQPHSEPSTLLLAPDVRNGQKLVWVGRIARYALDARGRPADSDPYARTLKLACSISGVNGRRFMASSTVSVREKGPLVTLGTRPPSTYLDGRATKSTGRADYDSCMFFSVGVFGAPPPRISVGTIWHFTQPMDAPSVEGGDRGTTRVVGLDAQRGVVVLQTILVGPSRGSLERIDATVERGIIQYETDHAQNPGLPPDEGKSLDIDTWSLSTGD